MKKIPSYLPHINRDELENLMNLQDEQAEKGKKLVKEENSNSLLATYQRLNKKPNDPP